MSGLLKLELERYRSRGEANIDSVLARYPDFSFDSQGRLIAAGPAIEMLRAAGCVVTANADIP
eukprot:523584-Prymnesium_polylepis.1